MELYLHFVYALMAWRMIKHRKDLAYISGSGNGVSVLSLCYFIFVIVSV
jgi:hypothetical protein